MLGSVLLKLRLSDWPSEGAPQLPRSSEIIDMFGAAWHSEAMRKTFFPLGLDACGPDIATHRYADLRETIGAELYFYRDASRPPDSPLKNKGARFSSIKFFGLRYQDAREWSGELPFGLSFEDTWPVLVDKLGRQPDEGRDEDLSGFGVWHTSHVSLHVHYDNVDNVVFSISLFQPGAWRSASP